MFEIEKTIIGLGQKELAGEGAWKVGEKRSE